MSRWSSTLSGEALEELVTVASRLQPELLGEPPVLIGEGISTLAYGWSTREGGWVLRIARDHPRPWTWRGGRAHEVELARQLRQDGVPVPASPVVVEEVEGLPTAILERRVTGTRLAAEMVRADGRMTGRIARLLDRFHAFDISGFSVVSHLPKDNSVAEFRSALAAVDLADANLRRRVEAAVSVLEARSEHRVLCHRDCRTEHLIVDDQSGEIVGLLDLGEVGIDDPAVDLAFLHGELGADIVADICAAMNTADEGLAEAAAAMHSLWPLLELAPGGETWGDPSTAYARLAALV